MKISIIVAQSTNRIIGLNNGLPWHIPEDLKHFKEKTTDKCVIMGRKTFESIGEPLPNRRNIVVTRDQSYDPKCDITLAGGLQDAVTVAKMFCTVDGVDEIFIIGGAQIYEQALAFADKIYLTQVHKSIADGDALFPEIDTNIWKEVSREDISEELTSYEYSFIELERQ